MCSCHVQAAAVCRLRLRILLLTLKSVTYKDNTHSDIVARYCGISLFLLYDIKIAEAYLHFNVNLMHFCISFGWSSCQATS